MLRAGLIKRVSETHTHTHTLKNDICLIDEALIVRLSVMFVSVIIIVLGVIHVPMVYIAKVFDSCIDNNKHMHNISGFECVSPSLQVIHN